MFSADTGGDCQHISEYCNRSTPHAFADRSDVNFTAWRMDAVREWVFTAWSAIRKEVVQSIGKDLHVRCPGGKSIEGPVERVVDAAEGRDEKVLWGQKFTPKIVEFC